MRPPRVPATDEPPPTPRPARRVPAARTGPLAGWRAWTPCPVRPPRVPGTAPRAHRLRTPRVPGPWTPATTPSSVANGPVVAANEAPGPTETGSPVEMDGTRERMPQVLGNLIYSTDRIWLWACSGRACAGVWWPVTRWRAVSRSCTFFLQTAISKRRDHADLPGKPGPGNRMNVQRRPSCTFILSPDAPQGEKTLEPRHRPHQDPRMNVQHGPAPPAGITTSHRCPRPHTTCTPPEPGSKHPAPRPLQNDTTSRHPDETDPDGPPPPPTTRPLALTTPQEATS